MHTDTSIKGCVLCQLGTWPLLPTVWAACVPEGCQLGAMNRQARMLSAVSWALARGVHVSMTAAQYSQLASPLRLHIGVTMETGMSRAKTARTSIGCLFPDKLWCLHSSFVLFPRPFCVSSLHYTNMMLCIDVCIMVLLFFLPFFFLPIRLLFLWSKLKYKINVNAIQNVFMKALSLKFWNASLCLPSLEGQLLQQ